MNKNKYIIFLEGHCQTLWYCSYDMDGIKFYSGHQIFLSKLFDSMRNESADWLLESYFIAGAKILLFLQTWKTNQVFTQFTYTIMI